MNLLNILNLYNTLNKPVLNISIGKNNLLIIVYNTDKIWNTFIKIKEKNYYLICISQVKKIIGTKFCLFINESINHVTVKNEKDNGIRI